MAKSAIRLRSFRRVGIEEIHDLVVLREIATLARQPNLGANHRSKLEVICLCRSGNRSLRVTEVLRRSGIDRSWSLTGGLALGSSSSHEEKEEAYAI